eukprot:TRINITY_DN285_c2_g1_i3.p1 TRINITY_DN285_c2_g1~~TRINITY_DN285_c2_g1_i3.p1  ORF type:complete len:156 (-),score=70.69 TRINITY_DN285_c2_g1_i3:45-512(-)
MSIELTIPKDYGYVLLSSAVMSLQCLLFGFVAGSLRRRGPFKGVMEYPDNGSGRFSTKLNEKDWITFNNYQRVHYNYLEGLTPTVLFNLSCGLIYPRFAAAAAVVYMIGRQLYALGYWRKGEKGRYIGALILDFALLALFGGSITAALKIAKLIK